MRQSCGQHRCAIRKRCALATLRPAFRFVSCNNPVARLLADYLARFWQRHYERDFQKQRQQQPLPPRARAHLAPRGGVDPISKIRSLSSEGDFRGATANSLPRRSLVRFFTCSPSSASVRQSAPSPRACPSTSRARRDSSSPPNCAQKLPNFELKESGGATATAMCVAPAKPQKLMQG